MINLFAFALATASAAIPMLPGSLTVDSRSVTVADLVGDAVPSSRIGQMIVLVLPDHTGTIELPTTVVVNLLRRRVPGLKVAVPDRQTIAFAFTDTGSRPKLLRKCAAAARDIAAGDLVGHDDIRTAQCTDQAASAPIRYDREARQIRATRALSTGTYLGALAPASTTPVDKGTQLTLRSKAGPVTVERPVETVQPARDGKRVFVRDRSGQVYAVDLAVERKERLQ